MLVTRKRGLGPKAVYSALPITRRGGGQRWLRVELRAFDGGSRDATWLAALLACGAIADPDGGAVADQLFAESGVTLEGYLAARAQLPERGLETPFGRTSLRGLLPPFCAIAASTCQRLGVPDRDLAVLHDLAERARGRLSSR